MMAWSVPAMPIPSDVLLVPALLPTRTRTYRMMKSDPPRVPKP